MTMNSYSQDYFAWTQQQVNHLKTGNLASLDIENLIEEIDAMGRSERRELASRMTVLIMHLLKWKYQPNMQSTSWKLTIVEQRQSIDMLLKDSPSLKVYLDDTDWLNDVWQKSVRKAMIETGLAKSVFPATPIWQPSQILDDEFLDEDESE